MAQAPLRYKRLLKALPENNFNVTKSAIQAGFSKSTAEKQQGRILKSAMKYEAKQVLERLESPTGLSKHDAKQLMGEIVGLSRENVMERLRFIANQEKDLSSALKVLAPLSKEYGVILQNEDENKVTVPILNVVVKEKGDNMAQQSDIIKL